MIYIAGPFFDDTEIEYLHDMIEEVKRLYPTEELFIPMEHFIPDADKLSNAEWSKKIFDMDVAAIDNADKIYALYLGHYSDSGTAWEIGYAYAKNKEVHLYIPDDIRTQNMSMMPINGCTDYNQKEVNQK